jgi:hypothetical protein
MPETTMTVRRKCPHCNLPLEIAVVLDLQQSASVRLKGAAPAKKGEAEEAEAPQPVTG